MQFNILSKIYHYNHGLRLPSRSEDCSEQPWVGRAVQSVMCSAQKISFFQSVLSSSDITTDIAITLQALLL